MASQNNRRLVGILGTGDFSRALAKRLLISGYDVIIGSRQPESKAFLANDDSLRNIKLVTTKECINSVSVILLAVHAENFKSLLENYVKQLDRKILVDVSNNNKSSKMANSNAEYLQILIANAAVVKAFNVISAYAMENDYVGSSKNVFIASDNEAARGIVRDIAKDMNFIPIDCGGLTASRKIERYPLRLFSDWQGPIGFAVTIFSIWFLFLVYIYYIEKAEYQWEQIFVKVLNKDMCMTGITVLAVTYLASSVAGLMQIFYGTKNIRFSKWMDKWMRNRKQLGLVSFFLISVHVIMSVLVMSQTYFPSWYHSVSVTIPANLSSPCTYQNINWMTWKGEAACMTGIFSFVILCFICATTFPSVADTLNWREWRFVQSKLGHVALFLAVVHVLVMGVPGWATYPGKIYKSITFLCSVIPWTTLSLKIILSMPCINTYIIRIRKGWDRNRDSSGNRNCWKPVRDSYEVKNTTENTSSGSVSCNFRCDAVPMTQIKETSNMIGIF